MRTLIVVAVEAEARAIGTPAMTDVVIAGLGRTNAAAATTEAIVRASIDGHGFDRVLSAGVAGSLPGGPGIGDAVIATSCLYVEEGLVTPDGFGDMTALGFPLGDFDGNAVPVDASWVRSVSESMTRGGIATVATCSGTDEAAASVVARTGAIAEAMEGAAVVHAARRLGVPGLEVRVISNTTGDRSSQHWDLPAALAVLGGAVRSVLDVPADAPA